ncbi:hypothetical protein ACQCVK_21450 [Rossellomorea vietnamensis]|uniref:hypothetical protein n=1 Tax=Rossellomorea vietnamensis TaxID=218284 RepID=UPI003CFB273C
MGLNIEELQMKIDSLKDILSKVDTESLLGNIATEFGVTMNPTESIFEKTSLISPFKQYLYLSGLLLSTPEESLKSNKEAPMNQLKILLNDIVDLYADIFSEEDGDVVNEQWLEARKVSMPVFINYFNTSSLTYEEQVVSRVVEWFQPFSEDIKTEIGIDVDELIRIFNFIKGNLQIRIDDFQELTNKVIEDQALFFDYMKKKKVSFEQAREELDLPNTRKFGEQLQLIHHIRVQDMNKEFGEDVTQSFINLFSMDRQNRDFNFYTEPNPFETSPIWRKSKDLLFIPIYKQIIHAILIQLTILMEKSNKKNLFYKNRDNKTEEKTEEVFKDFFGESAKYYTSVFENDKSQNEHDLVIECDNNILIIEVKASKVKEPFRNPDKAFKRIKRDFKSDGGIQKGYNQGMNLRNHIMSRELSVLYDSKGNEVVQFKKSKIKEIFIIVITAENMGILGCNTSYLLEKKKEDPYPWSMNIYDLETALEGIMYKNKKSNFFIEYLREREQLHEYIVSTDELEVLGYYLENGSFRKLNIEEGTYIIFDPNMSSVFDDIYFEKRGFVSSRRTYPRTDKIKQRTGKVNKNNKRRKLKQSKKSKKKNRRK